MNTFVYFFLSIFLTYLFLQIFRNPTHKSHAKSFLQRLGALLKRSLYATQFRRVCLYLNEEMRPLCHNADQLRASLCLMELIKVKRLKGFLFVIFLFGSFFFFSSHQSSFNIYSTSLTPFFEYASFLIKRVALLY